jgi:hypothetical protein
VNLADDGRLRKGLPFNKYDRSRFYGPFPDREVRYTDYPRFGEEWSGAVIAN